MMKGPVSTSTAKSQNQSTSTYGWWPGKPRKWF